MKTDKEKIDELIKESLNAEEAKFYEALGEQNLLEKLGQAQKGKTGWLVKVMTVTSVFIFLLFIYCGFQFFEATVPKDLIAWSTGAILCMLSMAMLKHYVWMQMDKNDILRELKRLELQLAALAHQANN
ncbi:MAG: DUF6768 family protein [Flavobacteriaceae bacterium]